MNLFKNEKTLPVLVVVASSLLVGVIVLYGYNTGKITLLNNKNQKQNLNQKIKEEVKRTDYTDVARKTLDWIDKQRNEEGWYILGKTCGQKDCEQVVDDKEVGNIDGLIATWARLNFYEQHKDLKDIEIVKKDIDSFYEKYKGKDMSDSLWLCKITYEIAQSKYIEQGQRDKLKELCFNTKYLGDEDLKNYWSGRFLKEIKSKFPPPITWEYYSLYERHFDNFFGSITDLVYKYVWSGDEKYKNLIEKYFLVGEDLVLNNKTIESQNVCLFGLSVLDEWKLIDKSSARLDYVVNFYKTIEIKGENNDLLANPICGLFVKKIYEATREESYLGKLNINNRKIIDNNQRDERGEIGDGFVRSDLSKGGFRPDRNIVENGLIVELIKT